MDEGAGGEDAGPVVVTTAGNRIEAMVVVTALEDAGYHAVLLSDDAGGLHPEMSWLYGSAFRVAVAPGDAEAARLYLDELDAGEHAIAGEDRTGDDHATVGLDGRRRGWGVLAVFVVAVFVVFRLVDSATSFGWF